MIDFVHDWSEKTELAPARFAAWLGIQRSQLTRWRERYGKINEHNGKLPRDHWILDAERQAILAVSRPRLEGVDWVMRGMVDENTKACLDRHVREDISPAQDQSAERSSRSEETLS